MPTLDQPWTQADFEASYSGSFEPFGILDNARPPLMLGYHRVRQMAKFTDRWTRLVAQLSLTGSDRVAVIGAGFGWGSECAEVLGIACASSDPSRYINTNKGLTEESDITVRMSRVGLNPRRGEGRSIMELAFDGGVRTRVQL